MVPDTFAPPSNVRLRKMTANILIQRATADDAQEVAVMVGDLLTEIMNVIGVQAFNFDLDDLVTRYRNSVF